MLTTPSLDMVEAEERRMNERKAAANKSHSKDNKQHLVSDKTARGTENKNKIAAEMKSAGKVDYQEAEEKERKNMEKQAEIETANRKDGQTSEPKVTDRNKAKSY